MTVILIDLIIHLQVQKKILPIVNSEQCIPEPNLDYDFLYNPANCNQIFNNIKKRKSNGYMNKIVDFPQKDNFKLLPSKELCRIPNLTHPDIFDYGEKPHVVKSCGNPRKFDFLPSKFEELAVKMRLLRMEALGPVSGPKSYIFLGDLAELEQALIYYTIEKLREHGYSLVSVPDVLPTKIIERCGLINDGNRTLVYQLDPHYGNGFSLSGTSEMALAYKLMNTTLTLNELPLKLTAVSRCFRAEASSLAEERGIYRYLLNIFYFLRF